jgi:chromosome segregation ATPase
MPAVHLHTDGNTTTMASDEAVSLRDHFERLLSDQRRYFERLLAEHEAHHNRDRDANNRALEEARERIDSRLTQLNELRNEVTTDRGQLVQRSTFDARMDAADKDRQNLRDEVSGVRAELANQRGRQAAYAAVLAVALVVVPILVQILLGR